MKTIPVTATDEEFRMQRISKLLKELEREVHTGLYCGELDEHLTYRFVFGVSKSIPDGVVICEFRTRPMPRYAFSPDDLEPRLKVVK